MIYFILAKKTTRKTSTETILTKLVFIRR